MKAADTKRAFVLSEARDDTARLEREARRKKPDSLYRELRLRVSVVSIGPQFKTEAKAKAHALIEIDMETARLLVPTLRPLIEAELKKLGVELP